MLVDARMFNSRDASPNPAMRSPITLFYPHWVDRAVLDGRSPPMPAERASRRRFGSPCPFIQLTKKESAMKTSTTSILSVPLLAAASIALSGCGQGGSTPTTIAYHQVGICKRYVTTTSTQQARADEGYAVFKVDTVDNTKNGSTFYFDPVRFYVNQSNADQKGNIYKQDRRFMASDSKIGPALGVKYVDKITVAKGEKADDVGFFIIPLATNNPSGGPIADQYNIAYDTGSGDRGTFDSVNEGILIVQSNPPDTTIIENCKELPLK